MFFSYQSRFFLVRNGLIATEPQLKLHGFNLYRKFGEYSLYMEHLNKPAVFENESGFLMLEGKWWQDIKQDQTLADRISHAAESARVALFKELNGLYSGMFYDLPQNIFYLFADKFGFQNIYYTADKNIFSNSIFAIINLVGYKPDCLSLAEHIILEYPIHDRTYFSNIKKVSTLNVLRCSEGDCCQLFYPIKIAGGTTVASLEDAFGLFFSLFQSINDRHMAISLSIGKDSRVLLYFLNKFNIPYDIYTFQYVPTHTEYIFVRKIASSLNKQANLVPFFSISNDKIIAFTELPVFTNEFGRLGQYLSSQNVDYVLIGLLGDHISGKLECFRQFGIKNFEKLGDAFFRFSCKGIQIQSFDHLSKQFKSIYSAVRDNCRRSFDKFRGYDLPKAELFHYLENLGCRRLLPWAKGAACYMNIILPYTEPGIFHAYLNLPNKLISSQQAHTMLAAKDSSASSAHSIGLPIRVPLSLEPQIRKPVQYFNRIRQLRLKKAPMGLNWQVNLKSKAVINFLGNKKIDTTLNIAHRLRCLDDYFYYIESHYTERGILL